MPDDCDNAALRIAVLFGGDSPEREISMRSGIAVAAALEQFGHTPVAVDPAEVDLVDIDWRTFDAAFIALHGGAGEDGRVQQILEDLQVPYTGSGPIASQLAMSKSAAKEAFIAAGIPTPRFTLLHREDPLDRLLLHAREIEFPMIIKPDSLGSSLGVNLCRNEDQFQSAVAECQFYDSFLIAEQYISGYEFTVTLIEREPLPALEILSAEELFSFAAKYESGGTEYSFHNRLSADKHKELQELAVAAADILNTAGLVRIDMIVDVDLQPWILEVNTVPGLTQQSLAPRAAAEVGIDMPTLCDQLVQLSLQRKVSS